MRKNSIIILIVLLAIIFLAVIFQPANNFNCQEIRVIIPKGASAYQVQAILEQAGILRQDSSFVMIARLLGASKNIQAGEYVFSPCQPLILVLYNLKTGKAIPLQQVKVTFPEGASIYKMGEILKQNQVNCHADFQGLVDEGITKDLRQKYWHIFKYVPSESLEGYLYPDTYWMFRSVSASSLADIMLARFDQVVMPFWDKSKKDTKFKLHEVLTLASIIEKEVKQANERAIISAVFYNRLKLGMPLAADPTIKYSLERPTKKVYYNQLEIDSLYNTYKRRGLPPGPICNPGIESIKAAVYPAKTNFLFFVAKPDGSHEFSRTFEEHQKARQEFGKK